MKHTIGNTLHKILQQNIVVMNADKKLLELQKKYVKENSKYNISDIVRFKKYKFDANDVKGVIHRIRYKDTAGRGLIEYCITRIKDDGTEHKGDPGFYYKYEKEIKEATE